MKTVCIYHSIDLDGWMSAAIVKLWWERNKSNGDSLEMIGFNYGQPIPYVSNFDRVVMCDISFPPIEMMDIKGELIWIDHHISAIKDNWQIHEATEGIRDTAFAACELAWKYFFPNEQTPEMVRLLGRYDCFGHKGTGEEVKVLEFQYGARMRIHDAASAFENLTHSLLDRKEGKIYPIEWFISNEGASIYSYLCSESKHIYKNGFEIYFSLGDFSGSYKFICINRERFNPINFGIDYHADGYDGCACFHYANGKWNFSLYNDNGLVDCSLIAKQHGGGGHKGASGFVVKDINSIINVL